MSRLEGGRRVSHVAFWGKDIPGGPNSEYKGFSPLRLKFYFHYPVLKVRSGFGWGRVSLTGPLSTAAHNACFSYSLDLHLG